MIHDQSEQRMWLRTNCCNGTYGFSGSGADVDTDVKLARVVVVDLKHSKWKCECVPQGGAVHAQLFL